MAIILVGNEKGGSGKTTTAVNMAAASAGTGRETLLVDADPKQQSSARWNTRRRSAGAGEPISCVTLIGPSIGEELLGLARKYETIIVDTGAEDSRELRSASIVADVLVVPVGPDTVDLWAVPHAESVFEKARAYNRKLRPFIALTRVHPRSVNPVAEFRRWLAEHAEAFADIPVSMLVARAVYSRAFEMGCGVMEMPRPDAKAASEMAALWKEVLHVSETASRIGS